MTAARVTASAMRIGRSVVRRFVGGAGRDALPLPDQGGTLMLSKDFIADKRDALARERATLLARLNAAEGAINLCDVFLAEVEQAGVRLSEATSEHSIPGGAA